jgi:hypothetical protein
MGFSLGYWSPGNPLRKTKLRKWLALPYTLALSVATACAEEAVAIVLAIQGAAGVAGEPKRQELTQGSLLYADKLIIVDRDTKLELTYILSEERYEIDGPGLLIVQQERLLVVEGREARRRAGKP